MVNLDGRLQKISELIENGDFLGQIREYYMDRDETAAFHSVILAGVYDVKNLRMKIIPLSQMIFQQAFNVSSKIANHLANTYALEYKQDEAAYR